SQVKYVAYKLRGAASSWWENLQTRRRRQRKQPIRTWRKMKRVMFARFLPVDYEQMLYSLYQNCRQSTQTVTEYAEEFMRLASRNQLSESDAQVARFNNGLRYDIQAIVSFQTSWTIDDAVRIALKAEQTIKSKQTIKKQRTDHSKSTHEIDGGKKTTTTTTFTHAVNKSSSNPYASPSPVGIKCYRCQEVGHTSNQCRATKRVNLAEGDKAHSESEDEGLIIGPNVVFEEDDHSEALLGLV
nr:RNA-directed DNA polymerase [Tanacetum cinerariifolium]